MVIKLHRRFVTLCSGSLSFFKGCFSFSQKNPSTCQRSQWESFSLFPQGLDLSSVFFFAMTQSKKGSQSAVVSVIFIKYPKADREQWYIFCSYDLLVCLVGIFCCIFSYISITQCTRQSTPGKSSRDPYSKSGNVAIPKKVHETSGYGTKWPENRWRWPSRNLFINAPQFRKPWLHFSPCLPPRSSQLITEWWKCSVHCNQNKALDPSKLSYWKCTVKIPWRSPKLCAVREPLDSLWDAQ